MPTFSNNNVISFNGPASVADVVSNPVDLTSATARRYAWFIQLNATATGIWAVTLQFNPDPLGTNPSVFGWQDEVSASLVVVNTGTGSALGQTNGSISGGALRGGVLNVASVPASYNLLFAFDAKPYQYRLRFQLTNTFVGNIPKISFSTGA